MRPTEPKLYRYPRSIEVGKTICKFSIGVLLLLIVLVIIVDDFPPYHTIAERLFMALLIALGIIGDIYFIYSWPKIKVDENGLQVEFLWKWIRIPWQDIDGVVEKISPFGCSRSGCGWLNPIN